MEKDFLITAIHRIIMIDQNEYPEKTTVFSSNIGTHELIFHFSGKSKVYFDNKILETKENTIRFLPQGKANKYIVHREVHGITIVIYFSTDLPINNEAFVVNNCSKNIASLFRKIFSSWIAKQDGYYFECISLLYKIFSEMQKNNYIPPDKYLQIKPAIDYIHLNFTKKPPSSDTLAQLCGISYSYIRKLFKRNFSMSPKAYMLYLKMNNAGELLGTGLYKVIQVANMCGYDNVTLFNKQFKKYYNLTPTQYIKKYKSSK